MITGVFRQGGNNLLDEYPDLSIFDISYFGNLPYDVLSPIGVNGPLRLREDKFQLLGENSFLFHNRTSGDHMSGLARVAFLFLFPIAVCAAADNLSSPDCELFYAVFPNRDAAGQVEGKVFDAVSGLNWEQRKALSRTQSKRLESILAISPGLVNRIKFGDILVTQGGYQGVSGISINARLNLVADAAGKDVISLASMIGYIYFQDSVLLLCHVPVDKGIKPAVIHSVLDAGSKDYLNPVSARLLFGMMMGYLNRVASVGYTYEQANDIFRVLEFDRADQPKKKGIIKHCRAFG